MFLFFNVLNYQSLYFNGLSGFKRVNLSMNRHDTFIKRVTHIVNG